MHYTLAFHVPYEQSVQAREKEISNLYEGEADKFDSLHIIDYLHGMAGKPWEHMPYAFVDAENNWHEKDDGPFVIEQKTGIVEVDWENFWQHHCLLAVFGSPHAEALIVYTDCHR